MERSPKPLCPLLSIMPKMSQDDFAGKTQGVRRCWAQHEPSGCINRRIGPFIGGDCPSRPQVKTQMPRCQAACRANGEGAGCKCWEGSPACPGLDWGRLENTGLPQFGHLYSAQQKLCPVGMQAQCGLFIRLSVPILECFSYLLQYKKTAPNLEA